MLNPYLIHQLHLQREAELERRLTLARMSAGVTPAGRSEMSKVREQVAAALIALARRIDPGRPAVHAGRPAHVM